MSRPPREKPLIAGIDMLMHDIKQPLLTISRLNKILHEEMESHPPGIPDNMIKIIDKIGMSCDSLLKMVGPLLQMAILGDCEVSPDPPSEFDLGKIVEHAMCNVTTSIEKYGGEILIEGEFPVIIGNEARWTRVFQNMMKNGLKYNESDVPQVRVVGGESRIFMIDNGIGIPKEHWEDVFTLSFRLHEEGRFGEGTGAGLYISKKFVEWDGGSLGIKRSDEKGTTFQIDLPEKGVE